MKTIRNNIRDRYDNLLKSVKAVELDKMIGNFSAEAKQHSDDALVLSSFCSLLKKVPQSLNYGFLYTGTSVDNLAKTVFRSMREGPSPNVRDTVSKALLKIVEKAQEGDAHAYLLLAHIKTKGGNDWLPTKMRCTTCEKARRK